MAREMDEREVEKIAASVAEKKIEDSFGDLTPVRFALRGQRITDEYGLVKRLFAYVQSLEERIAAFERQRGK
jgi:hypothetical protein